jgi:hypothetical protein
MDELEQTLASIDLPLALPEEAFLLMGKAKRRIPNFDFILQSTLSPLLSFVDANATSPGGGPDEYILLLLDGRYLKVSLSDSSITKLELINPDR